MVAGAGIEPAFKGNEPFECPLLYPAKLCFVMLGFALKALAARFYAGAHPSNDARKWVAPLELTSTHGPLLAK